MQRSGALAPIDHRTPLRSDASLSTMHGPATVHPGASEALRVGVGVADADVELVVVVVVEDGKGEPPQ